MVAGHQGIKSSYLTTFAHADSGGFTSHHCANTNVVDKAVKINTQTKKGRFHFDMNSIIKKVNIIFLLSSLTLLSCQENIDYKAAEDYILKSAQEWAEAINSGDSVVIDRIMADDFIGVSLRGEIYDKPTMIRESKQKANQYYKPKVFNMKIRFYGETAVVHGNEIWTRLSDSTSTTNIWTDTWIYRNKKWEIVAAQDLKLKQEN